MQKRISTGIVIAAWCAAVLCPRLAAQTLYSYTDENGVRIFTNIPPKSPVRDLTVSGRPLPPVQPAPDSQDPVSAYDPIINRFAGEYQIDPLLIKSMIAKESGFNPRAVSRKGAQGLMQLMPATAARHGVRNSFDPEENIRGGVKHMRFLLDSFGNDLSLSLAAYNAGENLVQKLGRIPNIPETTDYVRAITKRYGKARMERPEEATLKPPPMYRFLDQNGVLHLTNIPPVPRAVAAPDLWVQSQP